MRVYHERLHAPLSWWLLGVVGGILLGAEASGGYSLLFMGLVYLALFGLGTAILLSWGSAKVEVRDGALQAGRARLPLEMAGRVAALDHTQTRAMRGPRADPAAFLLIRPYLREAVYVEVMTPAAAWPPDGHVPRRRFSRARASGHVPPPPDAAPYWLLGTRRPADLVAAIERARPAPHPDGVAVG